MSLHYDEAKEKLFSFPLKYVVVGFRSDGLRGIPATYVMDVVAASDETLFSELKKFQEAKVFSISEIGTADHWKEKTKKHFEQEKEREEKELLSKLKQKYPNA